MKNKSLLGASLALALSLALCGAARADELADANALFAKKAYPQALQLYTKLGNAGNAEAQLHAGEMYLYGEAGAIDLVKADQWFRKAAAKGNKTAIAALAMMQQREVRRADIEYWMSKYDGAALRSGQYRCPAPRIPAVSKLNDEIQSVSDKVAAWQDCYNNFVKHLNASAPLTKLIPKDVYDLLTKDEMDKATAHLADVYARVAEDARISAKLVLADFGAWRDATDKYVAEHNRIVNGAPSAERQKELEARKQNYVPSK
jgi:TPR repeat protein